MADPKRSIWSWQSPPGAWIEVNPNGDPDALARLYAAAEQHSVVGAAFVLVESGQRPISPPETLGARVVGARPKFQPGPVTAATSDAAWRAYFAAPMPDEREVWKVRAALAAALRHMAGMQGRWTTGDLVGLAEDLEWWAQS